MSLIYAYVGDITKTEKTPEGDLLVWGKATGPDLDLDEQICDPKWLKTAMPEWAEYANVREQHSAIAAGVGVETVQDGDDWYVKALITDKSTAHKVETGTLKGYSIGIRNARLVKDAGAPNGRIVGGAIPEISLVDRPCNPTAKMAICKSASGGGPLLPVDAAGKLIDGSAPPAPAGEQLDLGADVLPNGMTVKAMMLGTIEQPDLGKDANTANPGQPPKSPKGKKPKDKTNRYGALPSQAATGDGGDPNMVPASTNGPLAAASPFGGTVQPPKAAEPDLTKRDFSQADRTRLAASGAAMPDGSFPIETAGDLDNAIGLAGNASNPSKARKHIKRRAAALGLSDKIPDTWKVAMGQKQKLAGVADQSITPDVISKAVAEAIAPLKAQLDAAQAELAKVAATPIPGGPVLVTQGSAPARAQNTTKAADYRAMAAQANDPSVAAAYRALAAKTERAPAA